MQSYFFLNNPRTHYKEDTSEHNNFAVMHAILKLINSYYDIQRLINDDLRQKKQYKA
jgi:hypothetical protein